MFADLLSQWNFMDLGLKAETVQYYANKLECRLYELHSKLLSLKTRVVSRVDPLIKAQQSRLQRILAFISMSSRKTADSRQSLVESMTRHKVHSNHRVLRNRKVAASSFNVGSTAMASSLNKLATSLAWSSRMARSNALRATSAAMLFGSYKLIEKYGDNDMTDDSTESVKSNTMFQRMVNTKNNLRKVAMDEAEYRFFDLFQKGPVEYVWGCWWYRVFQVPSLHDTLLKLLIGAINEPSFVEKSAEFGSKWIENCVMEQKVIDEAVKVSQKTFIDTPEVVTASYELTCWLVQQPKAQEIAAAAVERTFFSKYTFDIAMWQLSCAFFGAFFHPAIQ